MSFSSRFAVVCADDSDKTPRESTKPAGRSDAEVTDNSRGGQNNLPASWVATQTPPHATAEGAGNLAQMVFLNGALASPAPAPPPAVTDHLFTHPCLFFGGVFLLAMVCGFGICRVLYSFQLARARRERDHALALLHGTAAPHITRGFWLNEEVD